MKKLISLIVILVVCLTFGQMVFGASVKKVTTSPHDLIPLPSPGITLTGEVRAPIFVTYEIGKEPKDSLNGMYTLKTDKNTYGLNGKFKFDSFLGKKVEVKGTLSGIIINVTSIKEVADPVKEVTLTGTVGPQEWACYATFKEPSDSRNGLYTLITKDVTYGLKGDFNFKSFLGKKVEVKGTLSGIIINVTSIKEVADPVKEVTLTGTVGPQIWVCYANDKEPADSLNGLYTLITKDVTYSLKGDFNFKSFLGKKVEVKGTLSGEVINVTSIKELNNTTERLVFVPNDSSYGYYLGSDQEYAAYLNKQVKIDASVNLDKTTKTFYGKVISMNSKISVSKASFVVKSITAIADNNCERLVFVEENSSTAYYLGNRLEYIAYLNKQVKIEASIGSMNNYKTYLGKVVSSRSVDGVSKAIFVLKSIEEVAISMPCSITASSNTESINIKPASESTASIDMGLLIKPYNISKVK